MNDEKSRRLFRQTFDDVEQCKDIIKSASPLHICISRSIPGMVYFLFITFNDAWASAQSLLSRTFRLSAWFGRFLVNTFRRIMCVFAHTYV